MNKLYEEDDIQAIADSIRAKNGLQDTYKVSEMSGAIDNIQTYSSLNATRQYGEVTSDTEINKDFTLNEDVKEAIITVLSIHVGNDDTITCSKQSGVDLTITELLSNTYWSSTSYGTTFVCRTVTYKLTKALGETSTARIKITNPYGLTDYHIVCVTN